ncbi:hypothetical protein N658DRAFT_210026 [Parathielavia hyrcaniae]|uniref:Uncharacterized protein n=1 Tax=Parathielavia hyrcaniae TaxID=113614 RepID=A0AAN6Q0K5_9PEZI|nr:hypothetical protein N658DRAFT_210026 [Parathielavia hyrcaniae]
MWIQGCSVPRYGPHLCLGSASWLSAVWRKARRQESRQCVGLRNTLLCMSYLEGDSISFCHYAVGMLVAGAGQRSSARQRSMTGLGRKS